MNSKYNSEFWILSKHWVTIPRSIKKSQFSVDVHTGFVYFKCWYKENKLDKYFVHLLKPLQTLTGFTCNGTNLRDEVVSFHQPVLQINDNELNNKLFKVYVRIVTVPTEQ